MNVTLKVGSTTRSIMVTIDTETMDLIEDGRVWGKAWLWIDLTKMPASPPNNFVTRNITMVMNWVNETLKKPRVSRILCYSKGSPPLKPIVNRPQPNRLSCLYAGDNEH